MNLKKFPILKILLVAIVVLLLAGCNLPTPLNPGPTQDTNSIIAATIGAVQTQAALEQAVQQTVAALQTQNAGGQPATITVTLEQPVVVGSATSGPSNPTAAPSATSKPPTINVTPVPPTVVVQKPCDWAQFVSDVSVSDGTLMLPGTTFTKTWRLRNIGTCTWGTN